MSVRPGDRLGPYEVTTPAGEGGMGEVWKARDTRLDRSVAIKILPGRLASDPQFRQRFEREARMISQLEHPNICRLYDVGSDDGVEYLVMELLEGETLAEKLTRGALPLGEVLKYGAQIAEALAVAHRAGIVHRDLKPGNIMITRSGAKLLDFGLARVARDSAEAAPDAATVANSGSPNGPLTERGTILGTFQYMAPEQLEGEEADGRTDIFALGCVLYEMLTGRRAFEGKTRTSLIAAIVAAEPRPASQIQPMTPPHLERIVMTCLAKDREERWQSAHDLARELRWAGTTREDPGAGEATPRRRALTALLALLLLAAGAAAGALAMWRKFRGDDLRTIHTSIVPPRGTKIAEPTGDGEVLVLSPDGWTVAFIADGPRASRRITLRRLDAIDATSLAGTEGAAYPFWSPDGTMLAFFADGKLKKVALDGSPPVTICEVGSNPLAGDWNERGDILFSPSSGGPIHRVSAAGGRSEAVTRLDGTKETTHRWPRFLPDGEGFLYLAGSHEAALNSEVNALYATRLGSHERKLILRTRHNVEYADDHLLYVRGETLYAQPFDLRALEASGQPAPLAPKVHVVAQSFYATFSASPGRALIYMTGAEERPLQIVRLDDEGKEIATIGSPAFFTTWSLSPDGTRMAVTIEDPSRGFDLWQVDVERGIRTQLTRGGAGGDAVWSPDGERIVYSGPGRDYYVKSLDSDGNGTVLWDSTVWGSPVSWSPDGKLISLWTFDSNSSTTFDTSVLSVDGRKLTPVATTNAEEYPGDFSPDGRWLAMLSNASGQHELFLVSTADFQRRQQVSSGGADAVVWKSPSEVWYKQPDGTWMAVQLEERDGRLRFSPPTPLFKVQDQVGKLFPIAGGQVLAIRAVGEREAPDVRLLTNWGAATRSP